MSFPDDNKHWADEYIIDPLHGVTPAEETGIGGSWAPGHGPKASVSKQATGSSTSTNPFRREKESSERNSPSSSPVPSKDQTTVRSRALSNTSDGRPTRSSPRREAFAEYSASASSSRRGTVSGQKSSPPPANNGTSHVSRQRRSSSLKERYPGDPSVRPLDQIAKEAKAAHRSPHLRKQHLPGSDTIDKLDNASILGSYHHEGPYDAASLARNHTSTMSPVAAVEATNREALRATPTENIKDSIERHRPLDGTSAIPPGMTDRFGRIYNYKEGLEEDMMRNGLPDGGAYRQYEGIQYLPEDLKGKGEPSYTIEKQLKEHKRAAKAANGQNATDVELIEQPRPRSGERLDIDSGELGSLSQGFQDKLGIGVNEGYIEPESYHDNEPSSSNSHGNGTATSSGVAQRYGEWEKGHSKSGSGSSLGGLRRKIGSLRRNNRE